MMTPAAVAMMIALGGVDPSGRGSASITGRTTVHPAPTPPRSSSAEIPHGKELVMNCHPGEHGTLEGGPLLMDRPEDAPAFMPWPSTTVESNGPVSNRVDIVFVGDGFQAAQLPSWASVVAERWATMASREPIVSYRRYFNAHRVDVESVDGGVDNDPTQGIARNTALDMAFWCGGTERLLCVSTSKAAAAAANAPQWDQIVAVANSSKYGGAGYPASEISTFSAFNAQSLQVALHELGHSFGDLADEYDYGASSSTYTGPEPSSVNLTTLTEAQMQAAASKWVAWLGISLPTVGVHGSFEGGGYYAFGMRRPTVNSLMRTLNQPFNGPGLEQMIVVLHRQTKMIDSAVPAAGSAVTRGATVSAATVEPSLHSLTKQWFLGDVPIPGQSGASIATRDLPVGASGRQLRLRIVDETSKVRNAALRAQWLTEEYAWTLVRDACPGDLDGDGRVSGVDLGALLGSWGSAGLGAGRADIDGDGTVAGSDLGILVGGWGACQP
jgi:hypothetical protein